MAIPFNDLSPSDWNKLLLSNFNIQKGGSLTGFRGINYQRGYGFKSFFGNIFKALLPAAKSAGKSVAKEALLAGTDLASDLIQGNDMSESLKRRGTKATSNLLDKARNKLSRDTKYERLQEGEGIGYRRRKPIKRNQIKKKQIGFGKRKASKTKRRVVYKRKPDYLGY